MDDFREKLHKLVGDVFDAGRGSVPEPDYGDWPVEPSRSDEIQAVEALVSEEIQKHRVGPPMSFLGCTLRQDYSNRLFQVTSVGESEAHAGGGFAQLIALDDGELTEADTRSLLRDYAVVGAMESPAPILILGEDP